MENFSQVSGIWHVALQQLRSKIRHNLSVRSRSYTSRLMIAIVRCKYARRDSERHSQSKSTALTFVHCYPCTTTACTSICTPWLECLQLQVPGVKYTSQTRRPCRSRKQTTLDMQAPCLQVGCIMSCAHVTDKEPRNQHGVP